MGRRLKLVAKADFVRRLSQCSAIDALEELIWNALDEQATEVHVELEIGSLGEVATISVSDNGLSLRYDRAAAAFESLGDSPKIGRCLETGETLHGRRGEGRHKALSIGDRVEWTFTYESSSVLRSYRIEATAGREDPFYLCDEEQTNTATRGCVVRISNICRTLHSLRYPAAHREITARFAPFLLTHPDRRLLFADKPVRPKDVIAKQKTLPPTRVVLDGHTYTVSTQVIHWDSRQSHREAFFCGANGIPLHRLNDSFLAPGTEGTAFLKSDLFDKLHSENLLQTIEHTTEQDHREIVKTLKSRVRRYFHRLRQANAQAALNRLKDEGSYPYRQEPKTDIDRVERRVFDLCAIAIDRHLPNFSDGMDKSGRTLLLQLVREAIGQKPSAVGRIIREVCKLPKSDAERFASLLDDIPLSSLVNAAHLVAERLEFLKSFKAIVYLDPFDRVIKERTELQKILGPNTWLFGEEYALGTDDDDLRTVLEKHIEILGRGHLQPTMTDGNIRELLKEFNRGREKTSMSLNRIPDFMIWRRFEERRADEYEFLVIEIKRPGVAVGRKEHGQIEDYARAITSTPFFDGERTHWVFVVISDILSGEVEELAHQQNLPVYTTLRPAHGRYEIRAMPWSAIIQSAEGRHEHLRKWLGHNVSIGNALERAKTTYGEFLPPKSSRRHRRSQSAAKRVPPGKGTPRP